MSSLQAEPTIKFAVAVYRHGIRAPYPFYYPNNPYQDVSKYFPEGECQLTKVGKNRMYDVGKVFRSRYTKLLGDMYSSEKVYFQSTGIERSIMSAQIMAHSIYPPNDYQVWRDNETWQPIPVWIDNGDIDKVTILLNETLCPRYYQLHKVAIDKLNATKITELYEPLAKYTGRTFNKTHDLLLLWDNLFYQDLNGLPLPKWTEEYYPDKLRMANNMVLKACIADSPEMLTLTAGTLFHFIKRLLSAKASNTLTPDRNVYLHCGHDSSLVCLLNGIGNTEPLETTPGTTMVFELHEMQKQHFVKAFYFDPLSDKTQFKEISIPLCGNPCTLEDFLDSIVSVDPDTWKNMCTL